MPAYHPCPTDAVLTARLEGQITDGDALVFLAILRHCDLTAKGGYLNGAHPSLATVAQWSGKDRRTVQRACRRLEAAGLVAVIKGGGRGLANRYAIPLAVPEKGGTSAAVSEPERAAAASQKGGATVPKGRQQRPPTETPDRKPRPKGAQAPGDTGMADLLARVMEQSADAQPAPVTPPAQGSLAAVLAPIPANPEADAHLAAMRKARRTPPPPHPDDG